MVLKGRAFKFGDNVNTDEIIPARYLNTTDPMELAQHCLEDLDPDFVKRIKRGDIIVAGRNFGCGSSREHAPLAIKAAGISSVVAFSFARIFYRNAINSGLPIVECPEVDKIKDQDWLEIDLKKGQIKNLTTNKAFSISPFPPFMEKIIKKGGLMKYITSLER
jgi:3-isopropylmalate/(R)-2-methylmalate dehydratase small subunit